MALSGKVGGVFAPASLAGTAGSDTFSGDDVTVEFTLSHEYVKPYSEEITVGATTLKRGVDYNINYITGVITFKEAPVTGTDNISVSYNYHNVSQIGGFFEWSIDESAETLDGTAFDNNNGHRVYVAGLREWTASANRYWATTDRFDDWVGQTVVISFYADKDSGLNRFEGW